MTALLPLAALLVQTALFSKGGARRESFLKACVAVGVVAVAIVEVLSLGANLSFAPLALSWLLVLAGQVYLASSRLRDLRLPRLILLIKEERPALAAFAALALVSLAAGLLSPPNTFDALSYHLPRVMHWLQNGSVAHYPANDLRQLAFAPGASYLVAQAMLLGGGDRLAFAPQWLAYAGCAAAASLIARRLGAGRAGELLALALSASLPMAVLQSQTTQNDLLCAFWLSCFAVFALKDGEYGPRDLVWLGASLGLAMLTKATGLLFGAPLLLIVLARLARGTRRDWARHAAILLIAAVLSSGPLMRNKAGLGSFAPENGRTLKPVVGLRQTVSCAVKNAALSLPLPPVWSAALAFERHVLALSPEDPANNFDPRAAAAVGALCRRLLLPDEDFAAGPVHFLLLVWGLCVLGHLLWREREDPFSDRTALAAALLAGFWLFSAFFKWQEWANRLMLPLFILGAPLTAQILEGKIPNRVRAGLLSFLAVSGLFYAATAIHRPLVALPRSVVGPWGSPSILSADRRTLELSGYAKTQEKPLLSVVDTIVKDGCRRVGVSFGYNDMEYLLWRLTAERSPEPVMFKSVNVRNSSEKLPPEFPSEELCGVVESEGGAMIYFDAADMKKLHAAGNHEPPRISEIRNK